MSLSKKYLEEVIQLLEKMKDEEIGAIEAGGERIAEAIAAGKRVFAFGCSHSSLPVQDVVYRAGGLMLMNPIFAPGIDALTVRPTTLGSAMEKLEGYAKAVMDNTPIEAGDVLIVISVSGRNAMPVEMAQIAQERGIHVIGVTSERYSSHVESRHSSGKKMHDYADIVIDNKVDKGDAVLEAEGIPQKFCPASGVTSTALMHSLVAATIEKLLQLGVTPPVFLAANLDGGKEYNEKLLADNKDRIFYM